MRTKCTLKADLHSFRCTSHTRSNDSPINYWQRSSLSCPCFFRPTITMLYSTKSATFKAATTRPVVAAAPRPVARKLVAPVRASDADRLGDKASEAARDAGKSVSRGAEDAKDSIKDAGSKLQSQTDSSSKDVKKQADRAADDSEGMLKKAGKNIERAVDDAKDAANDAYENAKGAASDAADNIKGGAQDLGDRVQGKN